MAFSLYIQPFSDCCQVRIPGTTHQYQALRPEDIRCVAPDGETVLASWHVTINPVTQDVTVTFPCPQSGVVDITGASRLPPLDPPSETAHCCRCHHEWPVVAWMSDLQCPQCAQGTAARDSIGIVTFVTPHRPMYWRCDCGRPLV
jgi:hypothetical protein